MRSDLTTPPSVYINTHTTDAEKAEVFFKSIGFDYVPEYSDAKSKSFRLPSPNANVAVMFHKHERFKEFIRPNSQITDANKATEALFSICVNKKEDVDEWIKKAIDAGGAADPYTMDDYGAGCGMYTRSFADLDGHIWEAFVFLKSD